MDIGEQIRLFLDNTQFQPCKGWLPYEHVITPKDEDWLPDLYRLYSDKGAKDEFGMLLDWHDPGIRASNRIAVVSWYKNDSGGEFLMQKNLYSPLPCDAWGRLPLTLHQWQIIAPPLILSTQLWQWLPAVRHYFGDDTFTIGGFMGWHLQETAKPFSVEKARSGDGYLFETDSQKERGDAPWIGRIIYKHITTEYSQRAAITPDTPCLQ